MLAAPPSSTMRPPTILSTLTHVNSTALPVGLIPSHELRATCCDLSYHPVVFGDLPLDRDMQPPIRFVTAEYVLLCAFEPNGVPPAVMDLDVIR